MKKLKGGISTIVATIILAGLVIALIISALLPAANETKELGKDGTERISDMRDVINPSHSR